MEVKQSRAKRILITGSHRSGTTWVGTILAAHEEAEYIHEPLNVTDGPAVMRAVARHSFSYICRANERQFSRPFEEVFRAGCQAEECKKIHLRHTWTVIKDPFAFFSVPWLADRFGVRSIVTVRRPVSFVSSLKRLGWRFDHRHLLDQPLLMRDWLKPFRAEMKAALGSGDDVVGQGCLLWRMVYSAATRMKQALPETILVRHEDLSLDPWGGFHALHNAIGVPVNSPTDKAIEFFCNSMNPKETTVAPPHKVALNSRANLENWRHRLSVDEVARIQALTADVAADYYSEAELQDFEAAQPFVPQRALSFSFVSRPGSFVSRVQRQPNSEAGKKWAQAG